MRIFSKIVALCNICFIIAVILRAVELAKRAKGNHEGAIPFQPLESTVVILGYGAIFINIILVYIVLRSSDFLKDKLSPSFINVLRKMFGIILLAIAVKIEQVEVFRFLWFPDIEQYLVKTGAVLGILHFFLVKAIG